MVAVVGCRVRPLAGPIPHTHNKRWEAYMYTHSTTALSLGEHDSHASLGPDAMGVRSFCRTRSLIRQRADLAACSD